MLRRCGRHIAFRVVTSTRRSLCVDDGRTRRRGHAQPSVRLDSSRSRAQLGGREDAELVEEEEATQRTLERLSRRPRTGFTEAQDEVLRRTLGEINSNDDTVDVLGDSGLVVAQGRRGYRTSVDSLALAWRAATASGHKESDDASSTLVADLGAGCGVVGLAYALATRSSCVFFEKQSVSAKRCEWNARVNGADGRLGDASRVVEWDVADAASDEHVGRFDVVLCNPPYFVPTTGTPTMSSEEKLLARFESTASTIDFARFAASLLKPGGQFFVVYPHQGRERVIEAVIEAFGNARVVDCLDNPLADAPSLVFVRATLGEIERRGVVVEEESPCLLHPEPRRDERKRPYVDEFAQFLQVVAGA